MYGFHRHSFHFASKWKYFSQNLWTSSAFNFPIEVKYLTKNYKERALAKFDVFLMDEAPMLPKYELKNMNQLLRAIGNPNLPFVGKIVIFGGDFRQC